MPAGPTHPAAQPVIGQRRVIERCTREQLIEHVQQHYTGANIVVAAAGAIDPARRVASAASRIRRHAARPAQ